MATAKQKNISEPSTMEELLAATGTVLKGLKRGETIQGKVREVTAKALYVDFGGKTFGVVTGREYEAIKSYIRSLKPGDTVSAVVASPEGESGYVLLSLRRAVAEKRWNELEEKAKSGEKIELAVKEANKGGLMVEIDGIVGFLPGSQVGKQHAGRMEELVGRKVEVLVMEADRTTNRLIVSEKMVSEAGDIEARRKLSKLAQSGDVYEGEVTGVVPFGLFVKVPFKDESGNEVELEGLVHTSEISWEHVENPGEFYAVGNKVSVKVMGVDETSGRLSLSIKQLSDDPWQEMAKKYPVDTHVKGKVTRLAAYGAFVEVEEGLEGLLHISKIPVEKKIEVGDTLSCYVESVDAENRRLSLGLVLTTLPVGYK